MAAPVGAVLVKEFERRQYIDGFFSAHSHEPAEEELALANAMFEEWWEEQDLACDHCKHRGFMGRLLLMGNNQKVCIDCFCFLTGTDDRDPLTDPTARSGSGDYVAVTSLADFEEQFGPLAQNISGVGRKLDTLNESGVLVKRPGRFLRFLRWLGVDL